MRRFLLFALALGACFSFSQVAHAQLQTDTDSQRFIVVVPGNVQIIAPADILIIHDGTDNDQVFPTQQWEVRGNVFTGVTTTFEVMQPFIHSIDPTLLRDAQLDIAIASTLGPAVWNVDTATDATDYLSGDNDAVVQISSGFVGWAFADLTVTFRTVLFSQLMAGSYETTVVGTVTENP